MVNDTADALDTKSESSVSSLPICTSGKKSKIVSLSFIHKRITTFYSCADTHTHTHTHKHTHTITHTHTHTHTHTIAHTHTHTHHIQHTIHTAATKLSSAPMAMRVWLTM